MPSIRQLHSILKALKSGGSKITSRERFIAISVPSEMASLKTARLLYAFHARAAGEFFVLIAGIPPCLLPASRYRIVYPAYGQNSFRRIHACSSCDLKNTCPGWPEENRTVPPGILPVRDIPSEIVFELTNRCNLSCQYCTGSRHGRQQITLKTLQARLLEARNMGVPAVRFTGGEPLLHPELPKMLTLARQSGFFITLNTNATILPGKYQSLLQRTVNRALVSIKGFNPETEARLTGSTAAHWQRKLENIKTIRTLVPALYLGTVISTTLLDYFPSYARLVRILGPQTWALFRPMPAHGSDKPVPLSVYAPLARRLINLNRQGLRAIFGNALPFCFLPDLKQAAGVMSDAWSDDGNGRLILDTAGFYKASYFSPEPLGHTLKEAWASTLRCANHKPDYLPRACQSCDFFTACRGGSRVSGKYYNGSCQSPDPLFTPRSATARRIFP